MNGRKILVVEDEYLIADDLAALLREAHAEVLGPAARAPCTSARRRSLGRYVVSVGVSPLR